MPELRPADGGNISGSERASLEHRSADGSNSNGSGNTMPEHRSTDGRNSDGSGAENITMRRACMEAEQYLVSHGIADAVVDAWYLLEYVTGVSRAKYLADRDKRLSRKEWDAYAALIEKRGAHIPLQYLTGEQEFMGLPFLVNEDVLIPRQDTEILVETALTILKTEIPAKTVLGTEPLAETPQTLPYRVLDLCTGSGCIAISIAKLFKQWWSRTQFIKTDEEPGKSSCETIAGGPARRSGGGTSESGQVKSGENAAAKAALEIYASDISEAALAVARENSFRLGADVHFVQSDLFDGIAREFRCEQNEDGKDSAKEKAKASGEDSARDIIKNNEKGNLGNTARGNAGDSVRGNATARFDMIVSNPPYIRTAVIEELDEEVRLHEPHLALDGGEDGLGIYRRIIRESVEWLNPGGWLLFEIGYDQGGTVSEIMRQHGFSGVRVTKDLAGLDRVVSGRLCTREDADFGHKELNVVSGTASSERGCGD